MNARVDAKAATKAFADYKGDAHYWITLATGDYYPDILKDACQLYAPVLVAFGQMLKSSESSERLFREICAVPNQWMRIQLARVFRKYVSPATPVEMLKKKNQADTICAQFGASFRPIHEVQKAYSGRPIPDEALCAQASSMNGIKLSYHGKRPASDILAMPPGKIELVWPNDSGSDDFSNRLYFAENLSALLLLLHDSNIAGKVRLIYIDPPYSTNSVFQSRSQQDAYADLLTGAAYLEFMRQRLILLRELMADDGSIYVHLDENMVFHVKVLLDEVFGPGNFRNMIVRKKCNSKNFTRKTYGKVIDYILFYTKSDKYVWSRPLEDWSKERAEREYPYIEKSTGRRYKKVPIHAPGIRNGETGKLWRGMMPPPGKHWQYVPNRLDEMDARGEIYWSPTGNPRRKVYFDQSEGIVVQDLWLEFLDAHNQNIKITGYPTEKNLNLLRRIIGFSSNPGDLVLDCFSGSGTTLDAATGLRRKWIGIDNSSEAIIATLRRLKSGLQRMGDYVNNRRSHSSVPRKKKMEEPSLFSTTDFAREDEVSYETQNVRQPFGLYVENANRTHLSVLLRELP